MNKNPLVSVVIITYNSEKTILETLESIKKQTYNNIELIVSDDCSKDDTVNICKEWIDKNSSRFSSSSIITTLKNSGIAGNLNRGYHNANGIWIKSIAGDDILMESCIESNVNYVLDNPQTEILISKVQLIGDKKIIERNKEIFKYGAFELTQKELLYLLLVCNFIPASTLFIRKDVFEELGGFDEEIPLLEDYPFWIKALMNNKIISFNNVPTVMYRMTENSISLSSNINPLYLKSVDVFCNQFIPKCQKKINMLLWLYCQLEKYKCNKPFLLRLLLTPLIYLNPMSYYIKYLKNQLEKKSLKYYN